MEEGVAWRGIQNVGEEVDESQPEAGHGGPMTPLARPRYTASPASEAHLKQTERLALGVYASVSCSLKCSCRVYQV